MYKANKVEDLPDKLRQRCPMRMFGGLREDRIEALVDLEEIGFLWLAWENHVRYLLYDPATGILLKDVEGDLYYEVDPSERRINNELQKFDMRHVSLGEKWDERYPREELPDLFRPH